MKRIKRHEWKVRLKKFCDAINSIGVFNQVTTPKDYEFEY